MDMLHHRTTATGEKFWAHGANRVNEKHRLPRQYLDLGKHGRVSLDNPNSYSQG
jgi:hypothetical protein